jgi:phosphoribosylaminoimidazole (AIR) synthetase
MIAAVPAQEAQKAVELLTQAGEKAYVIGTVVPGDDGVEVID